MCVEELPFASAFTKSGHRREGCDESGLLLAILRATGARGGAHGEGHILERPQQSRI